ncbi:MAG: sigma-54-dependent Fis family transcriptional regulator [Planctomycetaceae bacterium]|nr:sigma-54-dependent Fis family transcriptional regulator [Planctomycetaceae bacterium]
MEKLLVIDDEPGIRSTITRVLESENLRVFSAANAQAGLSLMAEEVPQIVLLDLRLGNESGLEVFESIRERFPRTIVIFITGHGTADTAIESMKLGAFDYLVKPLDLDQLTNAVDQARRICRQMHAPTAVELTYPEDAGTDRLIGRSSAIQTVCKQIGRIAPQDVNVLVLGESGTGKELVARAIYQHSRRAQAPFLAINCAAIPETLLESELFGHERGAFTGADARRVGKFEQCHGGTILLDEVGDMPLSIQARILRLLQDGQFQRVGGNQTLKVDVRVIAATNQNLDQMIEQGRFRQDLYYRLRGVTITLPPLRDRCEDIPEIAHALMFRYNQQLGTQVQSISPEALELLVNHRWPGNIRELQSVIREALIISMGTVLLPEFLPLDSRPDTAEDVRTEIAAIPQDAWQSLGKQVDEWLDQRIPDFYRRILLEFDRLLINSAMSRAGGLQTHAAELLGLSRPTLRSKLRSLRLLHDGSGSPNS